MEKFYCQVDGFEEEDDQFEEEDEIEATEIVVSYACEDCDYRWEVTFEDEEDEAVDDVQYCPMCGSANTTQI
ncbi:MAG: hypothetical protein KDK41_00560 [Leptospiraceae bacterium]|nr:hypothetical protein [Leptospiraceae bacterium]MCB1199104.1 hypothetical protein [Leptospiraceae bacterium]